MIWNLKLLAIATTATLTLLAASAWYAYAKGLETGRQQVMIEWQEDARVRATAESEEMLKAQQRERALQALLAKQRKDHQREAARLAADFAAVISSLHNRTDRPGDGSLPQSSGAGTEPARGCTGAELYRQDSEFLAREAQRADQLRIALKTCIGAYDAAKREINGE
jgi:hypothetical protein